MKKLLRNKKGFTLMEMLIVVAIIVILVAISVPTFSASLDDAKKAVDDANFRAAKAAAVVYQMETLEADVYYYDAEAGDFTTDEPDEGYGQTGTEKGKVIAFEVTATSTGNVAWVDVPSAE